MPKQPIKPFVRQVLGCQCPDALFEQVECSSGALAETHFQRWLIGRRLLVYLYACADQVVSAGAVSGLMAAGVGERDANGYNRFRLVLVGGRESYTQSEVTEYVAKAHLHQVSQQQWEHFFGANVSQGAP